MCCGEAFVGPVHAEALSAEQLQERKDTMKAKRLVQVQAEREARGSTCVTLSWSTFIATWGAATFKSAA
jgi:hypothetical protein